MRLAGLKVLDAFVDKRPDARGAVKRWKTLVVASHWRNFAELRATFASADQVKLGRELVVTVFNVGGNKYRMISEVFYEMQAVRALKVMTHDEYGKERWKRELMP
jgi:mRNA interferase HigB